MATRRSGLFHLEPEECWQRLRLANPRVGRLAFAVDQHPLVLPVNYAVDGDRVVIRFNEDTVLDEAVSSRVAFEVDDIKPAWEGGWSVVIQGQAVEAVTDDQLARLRRLPLRPWAGTDRIRYLRIDARHGISGRAILPRAT